MELTNDQVDALADDVLELAREAGGEAADYLDEFARYVAGFLASLVFDPDDDALERLEAQALAVLETVEEITDQATRQAIVRAIVGAARFLSTAARAA